jgi:hypothetical protein
MQQRAMTNAAPIATRERPPRSVSVGRLGRE